MAITYAFKSFSTGTPKRVKVLDYQTITLGHPALDIWAMVYSATDAEYRRDHLEADLQAYYGVLSSYMDIKEEYSVFRQELEQEEIAWHGVVWKCDNHFVAEPQEIARPFFGKVQV